MARILVLNGPNLNKLGTREPNIYGTQTLSDIEKLCIDHGTSHGFEIDFRQTNSEGTLVDWIQEACDGYHGVMINAAAYTHTSLAVHDALKLLSIPIIEVHLSNPHEREDFRHHSYVSLVAAKVIAGHGARSYILGLDALAEILA